MSKRNFKQLNMWYPWRSLEQNTKCYGLIITPRLGPPLIKPSLDPRKCHVLHRQSEQGLGIIIIGLNKLFKNYLLDSNFHQTVFRRVKLALMSQHMGRIWLCIAKIAVCMRFKNEFQCPDGTTDQNLMGAGSPVLVHLGMTSGEHYMPYKKELENSTEEKNRATLCQSPVSWCSPDQEKSFILLKLEITSR